MRKWFLLLPIVLLAIPTSAIALQPVSADQLEQLLAQSRGLSDTDMAAKLSDLELTQQFSRAQVARWSSQLAGPRSQRALIALADRSIFLAPPASELPAALAPPFSEQRHIMGLAAAYVTQAIPQLPHFYATRAITHYEGDPADAAGSHLPDRVPCMRFVSRETWCNIATAKKTCASLTKVVAQPSPIEEGLRTWGVFGPVLSLVLLDAAQNKLAWERWEQGRAGFTSGRFPFLRAARALPLPGELLLHAFRLWHGKPSIRADDRLSRRNGDRPGSSGAILRLIDRGRP